MARHPSFSALAALWLAGLLFLPLAGCGSKPAEAPASYTHFAAEDRSFQCDQPAGWESTSAGGHGVASGVLFKKGPAKIDITADLQGSLMGDIARSSNNMLGGLAPGLAGKTRPPVETLHEMGKKELAESIKDYQEQPMQQIQGRMGDARMSEYTGGGGIFSPKVHGLRVTMLGGERRITVICQCPESDWQTLHPAFTRVIGSLSP